ncbi:LacI family DNA-binding transcriptional regulator [Microbacterium sp. p3-SID336]|uniref:LacI family DNA-binding transcriptional regulator n=1 Tax=Microbacterium sp. p3-SID336 TaxID=2916212 RepID=UPI0021A6067C|nr:LacI family DNA-binding transcriptional regulator [Microbacterium sp. p3-SID336]MCT1479983.1 LacI family transcriptional regulator [Microbacterium sp. p3-SID336]
MGQRPTMNDVARQAGVALKTVSRFVNGETNIDPVRAERIAAAISALGYRRNLSAASIRPGWSSRTIGLVISDLANPYYAALGRAVERVAADEGYMVMISSSEEDGDRHDRIVDRMLDQRVDGLIVVPPRSPARDWSAVPPPLPPVVFVDRPGALADAHSVIADNRGGARSAVLALAEQGVRRIAFLGDDPGIRTMHERHQGYAEGMRELGLPLDPALVHTRAHAAEEAADIVAAIIRDATADAVFAANNRATFGALQAFREAGARLPLIGFDDFEAAALTSPATSVVEQDVTAMGELAMRLILAALRGEPSGARMTVLPTTLRLRGSERPAG